MKSKLQNGLSSLPYGFLQLFSGGGGGGGGDTTFTEEQVKEREKAAASAAAAKAVKDRFGDLADMDLKDIRAAIALKKKADEDAAAAAKSKSKDKDDEEKGISPEDVDRLLDERLKEREKEQEKHMFQRELRADVKVLASELGFADFEDAIALADFSKVKRTDKGDLEGVKEALEDLLKKKPHLGKQKPGTGAFGASLPGGSPPADKKAHQEALIKAAQTRGLPTNTSAAYDPWKTN